VFLTRVEIRGDEYPEYERYPFNIRGLSGRQSLDLLRAVTFFVGENGSGKSTLLQAIARSCGLDLWGQPRRALAPGELRAEALCPHLEVGFRLVPRSGGFFGAEGFREWAEFIDDVARLDPGQAKYHGGQGLTARSHGEGILAYLRQRYRVPGLYFIDEPESALSPRSQLELVHLLHEFGLSGQSQFLVATHSPILMTLPNSQLFHFGDGGVVERDYRSTEHFQLYQRFLSDPSLFLP